MDSKLWMPFQREFNLEEQYVFSIIHNLELLIHNRR